MHCEALDRLIDGGVIAVVRGIDQEDAIPVSRALVKGGVRAVEVTADTPGAMNMIEVVSGDLGADALVGVGTVLDAETARAALLSGAEFVVSPSLHRDVIDLGNRYGVPVIPGVTTPTEAITAYQAGADVVKLFPASVLGPDYLAALGGPLSQIPVISTGGIDKENAGRFIAAGAVAVGAGSSIVNDEAIERGEFDRVTESARDLVESVEQARSDLP